MSVASAVARGRAAAEKLMVDTVTVDRWDGTYTFDDTTGEQVKNYGAPIYSGKGRVQQQRSVSDEDQGGGRLVTILVRELQLPVTVTGLQVDDRVTIDTSQDPDLVGREFRVASLFGKTHATARRVSIEEVTS